MLLVPRFCAWLLPPTQAKSVRCKMQRPTRAGELKQAVTFMSRLSQCLIGKFRATTAKSTTGKGKAESERADKIGVTLDVSVASTKPRALSDVRSERGAPEVRGVFDGAQQA